MRLAIPPPPRLIVAPPAAALLGTADAATFAGDLADALADRAVPAVVGPDNAIDWRLAVTADRSGGHVIPRYTIRNPAGHDQGSTAGGPISPVTWSHPTPVALHLVALRDAPAIEALLDRVNAAIQDSDPNSLVNRPARIALLSVKGAPGDGNQTLHSQIAAQLTDLGIHVQAKAPGADYTLSGTVHVVPSGTAGQSRVEIQWTVHDVYGREAGHLLQMNDVPDGSLDGHWGDVAVAVATEAAGGVREVLLNQTTNHRLAGKAGT